MGNGNIHPYERGFKLVYLMMGLVVKEARSIYWFNQNLQRLVDEPPPFKQMGIALETYSEQMAWWEEKIRGKGYLVMEVIGQFYNPALAFNLTQASSMIHLKMRSAAWWIDWAGDMKTLRAAQVDFKGPVYQPHKPPPLTLSYDLGRYLNIGDGFSWNDAVGTTRDQFETWMSFCLRDNLMRAMPREANDFQKGFLTDELIRLLALAVALKLADWPKGLDALLQLWREGTIPYLIYDDRVWCWCKAPIVAPSQA